MKDKIKQKCGCIIDVFGGFPMQDVDKMCKKHHAIWEKRHQENLKRLKAKAGEMKQ